MAVAKIYEIHIREFELDIETGRQETKHIQTITKFDVSNAIKFTKFVDDLIEYLNSNNSIN